MSLESRPLPSNPYPSVTVWSIAYDICRQFEFRFSHQTVPVASLSELACARFLGYLVIEAPNDPGRRNISREIIDCVDDAALVCLAKLYMGHFIQCFFWRFKNHGGHEALSDPEPASDLFTLVPNNNDIEGTLKYLLEEAPQDHATAKTKALIRDQYHCMLTGAYDIYSLDVPVAEEAREAAIARQGSQNVFTTITEASHILPEYIETARISDGQTGTATDEYTSSILAIVNSLGQIDPKELSGSAYHRLENIMTLDFECGHHMLDSLCIWLESTSVPNKYKLSTDLPQLTTSTGCLPVIATFMSSHDKLPLPDPRYLALHAACARVIYFSGVGPYIGGLMETWDDATGVRVGAEVPTC